MLIIPEINMSRRSVDSLGEECRGRPGHQEEKDLSAIGHVAELGSGKVSRIWVGYQ